MSKLPPASTFHCRAIDIAVKALLDFDDSEQLHTAKARVELARELVKRLPSAYRTDSDPL